MKLSEILHSINSSQTKSDNVPVEDWLYYHVDYLQELGLDQESEFMYSDHNTEKKKLENNVDHMEYKCPNIKVYLKRGDDEKYFVMEYENTGKEFATGEIKKLEFHGDKSYHTDYGFNDMIREIEKIIDNL